MRRPGINFSAYYQFFYVKRENIMSHSSIHHCRYDTENCSKEDSTCFIYNSDLGDEVVIKRVHFGEGGVKLLNEIAVPAEHILEFVAKYVASEKISKLEQASYKEILGLQ